MALRGLFAVLAAAVLVLWGYGSFEQLAGFSRGELAGLLLVGLWWLFGWRYLLGRGIRGGVGGRVTGVRLALFLFFSG